MNAMKKEPAAAQARPKLPSVARVAECLMALRPGIMNDYRASDDPDDHLPGIQVTLGADCEDREGWAVQTGDNSFTGSAYGFAYWGVSALYRRTNCRELARELIEQIAEQWWQCH